MLSKNKSKLNDTEIFESAFPVQLFGSEGELLVSTVSKIDMERRNIEKQDVDKCSERTFDNIIKKIVSEQEEAESLTQEERALYNTTVYQQVENFFTSPVSDRNEFNKKFLAQEEVCIGTVFPTDFVYIIHLFTMTFIIALTFASIFIDAWRGELIIIVAALLYAPCFVSIFLTILKMIVPEIFTINTEGFLHSLIFDKTRMENLEIKENIQPTNTANLGYGFNYMLDYMVSKIKRSSILARSLSIFTGVFSVAIVYHILKITDANPFIVIVEVGIITIITTFIADSFNMSGMPVLSSLIMYVVMLICFKFIGNEDLNSFSLQHMFNIPLCIYWLYNINWHPFNINLHRCRKWGIGKVNLILYNTIVESLDTLQFSLIKTAYKKLLYASVIVTLIAGVIVLVMIEFDVNLKSGYLETLFKFLTKILESIS